MNHMQHCKNGKPVTDLGIVRYRGRVGGGKEIKSREKDKGRQATGIPGGIAKGLLHGGMKDICDEKNDYFC